MTMPDPFLIDVRMVKPRAYRHIWRETFWRAHNMACGVCHQPVEYDEFQIDHIVPRCQGGTDDWDNLQPAHKPCNNGRPRGPKAAWARAIGKHERRAQQGAADGA